MKATLKNYRQAPRKVRLIADSIRGEKVDRAMINLSFLKKRAAEPMKKLITSAVSNAKNAGAKEDNLIVKDITVDKGVTFKRYMPRARGRASAIRKETSHISVTLGERKEEKQEKAKVSKKEKQS